MHKLQSRIWPIRQSIEDVKIAHHSLLSPSLQLPVNAMLISLTFTKRVAGWHASHFPYFQFQPLVIHTIKWRNTIAAFSASADSYLMSDCHEYSPQLTAHIQLIFLWKASLLFKEEQYTLMLNAFILAAVEQITAVKLNYKAGYFFSKQPTTQVAKNTDRATLTLHEFLKESRRQHTVSRKQRVSHKLYELLQ